MDYYNVLGLIPGAESVVIKAAYRALTKIYHPDKNKDINAGDRIREINAAYEILSDPDKKSKYDKEIENDQNNANESNFNTKAPFNTDPLEGDWKIATDFHPDLLEQFNVLAKISWRLAFAFKVQLLDNQKYNDAEKIGKQMRDSYLSKYFGKNQEILKFAESLLMIREITAAIELNSYIKVLGKSVSHYTIIEKINQKYPKTNFKIEAQNYYFELKNSVGYEGFKAAVNLVKMYDGEVHDKILSPKCSLKINNSDYKFNSDKEFCDFILEMFASRYG
jgi:curved DNA-binding protein CbpA